MLSDMQKCQSWAEKCFFFPSVYSNVNAGHSYTSRKTKKYISVRVAEGCDMLPVTVGAITRAGCLPPGFKRPHSREQDEQFIWLTVRVPASSSPILDLPMMGKDPHTIAISALLTAPHWPYIHHKALLSPPTVWRLKHIHVFSTANTFSPANQPPHPHVKPVNILDRWSKGIGKTVKFEHKPRKRIV